LTPDNINNCKKENVLLWGERQNISIRSFLIFYFFLLKLLCATDEPEKNTDKTDFSKRKTLKEGL
jgi:hypothetical protein